MYAFTKFIQQRQQPSRSSAYKSYRDEPKFACSSFNHSAFFSRLMTSCSCGERCPCPHPQSLWNEHFSMRKRGRWAPFVFSGGSCVKSSSRAAIKVTVDREWPLNLSSHSSETRNSHPDKNTSPSGFPTPIAVWWCCRSGNTHPTTYSFFGSWASM